MAKIFSTEDGNLNASPRVARERVYSDFDLTFAAKTTGDGDVYKKTDAGSVKQAIKTLLLTRRFEKPYRPEFGADLYSLLFGLADEETGAEISQAIKDAILRYEPRVEILRLRVSATPDNNTVNITIEFKVIQTGLVDTIKVTLANTSVGPDIPVTLSIAEIIYDNIILTQNEDRMLTEAGFFIARDIGKVVDGAVLTQDGDMISLPGFNLDDVLIITQ
jgi:uncharacterized protein